jgi:5-methylcytosine-specific restriction enzyme subunit McrC
MPRPTVTVSEWQKLKLPPRLNTLTVKSRLVRAGRSPRGAAFIQSGNDLGARGLVGLISTRDLHVQILPKLYPNDDPKEGISLLHDMLRLTLNFPNSVRISSNQLIKGTLLDLLIGHVARRLFQQLLDDFPRRYDEITEVGETIRGRIDLAYEARKLPGTEHRVRVRFAPLQRDNTLSRVCRAVVEILLQQTSSEMHRIQLYRCLELLRGVRPAPLTHGCLNRATTNRLESGWDWVVTLGEALVRNASPDILHPGARPGFSILFPLDGLFERLLRGAIRNGLSGSQWQLPSRKGIGHLLRHQGDDQEVIGLYPDLVLHGPAGKTVVGDAKWKRLDRTRRAPDRLDAFQLVSYLGKSGAKQGLIFYPAPEPLESVCRIQNLLADWADIRLVLLEVDIKKLIVRNRHARLEAERKLANSLVAIADEG